MSLTPPLPAGFQVSSYKIQSLIQTDANYHLYIARDQDGTPVILREFCPNDMAVRDPELGKLRYNTDVIDVENDLLPRKREFEKSYKINSILEFADLGTVYFVYPQNISSPPQSTPTDPIAPPTNDTQYTNDLPTVSFDEPESSSNLPQAEPTPDAESPTQSTPVSQRPRKKKNSNSGVIVAIVLLAVAAGTWVALKDSSSETDSNIATTKPTDTQINNNTPEPTQPANKPVSRPSTPTKTVTPSTPTKTVTSSTSDSEIEPSNDSDSPSDEELEAAIEEIETTDEQSSDDEEPSVNVTDTTEPEDTQEIITDEAASSNTLPKDGILPRSQVMYKPNTDDFKASIAKARKKYKPTTKSEDVQKYIAKYASKKTPLSQWKNFYADVYNGWFGADPKVAEKWITTFGPLGLRAIGLDSSWSEKNFRNLFPKNFVDPNGEPVLSAYKVVNTLEGSPAENKVKPGDYIVGVDGKQFKTSNALNMPYGPYQHQGSHGLDMHAGILVDKAEGVGKITLNVIRAEDVSKIKITKSIWKEIHRIKKINKTTELKLSLKGDTQVRLKIDDCGDGIGNDGFEWYDLKLVGKDETIELKDCQPVQYQVGYGTARFDKEKNCWWAHSNSNLVFEIPEGEWLLTGTGKQTSWGSVGLTVYSGGNSSMPKNIKKLVKNVTFNIPQIGTFAPGFPANCSKSDAIIKMMSEWLVAQQNEDGSWDRPGGYCGNHFDTAWAGLALMSTGDKKYDPVIKKAAHYIAFSGSQCWWAVPQATAGVFLCEYWLRYRDDSVLPAIRNGVQRMKNEVLYGDYVTGHGIHPGYRGTGVSIGGSHMCLFLAMSSKTPAHVNDGVLEKMMDRAQELCPTGMGPYGRTTETFTFKPNMECGGTYSGRHGPYYVASLLTGGPALYTRNSQIMYGNGPIGGADQGHSSETLSIMWALPCYWLSDPVAYYKNMEAFRWKLTLLRPFDGGMIQNPNRLELMSSDPCIGTYIRTSIWINALCAPKQNLAITGNPKYLAKTFRNVPPINDTESRFLQTYIRNWSLVKASLGTKAPQIISKTIKEMKDIPVKEGCRFKLLDILNKRALSAAKAVMALKDVDVRKRATCAELLLGIDIRIFFEPVLENGKVTNGKYALRVEVQQPLGGRGIGLHRDKELQEKANTAYNFEFSGDINFQDANKFTDLENIKWDAKTNYRHDWNVFITEKKINGPSDSPNQELSADIAWSVDDLTVKYTRPLITGKFEAGCEEKEFTLNNLNHLWVTGILMRDHGNHGCSFFLTDGSYIAAATQGNQIIIHDETNKNEEKTWVTPNDSCLPRGAKCLFRVSPDWRGLECRVSELRLLSYGKSADVDKYTLTANGASINTDNLTDRDALTKEELSASGKQEEPLILEATLNEPTKIRAVDIKLENGYSKVVIEALVNNKWEPIHWGAIGASVAGLSDAQKAMYSDSPDILRMAKLPGNGFIKYLRTFEPIETKKLRIKLSQGDRKVKLAELHILKADEGPIEELTR